MRSLLSWRGFGGLPLFARVVLLILGVFDDVAKFLSHGVVENSTSDSRLGNEDKELPSIAVRTLRFLMLMLRLDQVV